MNSFHQHLVSIMDEVDDLEKDFGYYRSLMEMEYSMCLSEEEESPIQTFLTAEQKAIRLQMLKEAHARLLVKRRASNGY